MHETSRSRFSLWNRIPETLAVLFLIGLGVRYWYSHRIVMPESPSIVVVPVKPAGEGDSGFLSDAVINTLTAQMSGIPGIETKSPPSSIEFEQVNGDFKRVAQAYDVNLV